MSRDESDLKSLLRRALESEQRSIDAHPEPALLIAYRAGELGEPAAEQLRDHLTRCSECSDLLLDLASFPDLEPPPELEALEPSDTGDEWRALRSRIDFDPAPARQPTHVVPRASRPSFYRGLLAAALVAAVAGLSWWASDLRRQLDDLSQPVANTRIYDLIDAGDPLRQGREPELVVHSPETGPIVLILNPSPSREFPDYRVDIREVGDPSAPALWTARGFRPGDEGNFTLTLPRDFLLPEKYSIHLSGLTAAGEEHLVARFTVTLADSESSREP